MVVSQTQRLPHSRDPVVVERTSTLIKTELSPWFLPLFLDSVV